MVSVKPLLKKPLISRDGEEQDAESIPVISNVPVCWPSGGGYFAAFPLAKGDPVTLIFADRSLDRWLTQGGEVDPMHLHTHELTDAFAIPGGRAKPQKLSSPSTTKMVIGKDGDATQQITIDGTDIKLCDTATQYVAMSNLVTNLFTSLATAINGWTPVPNDGGAALKSALTAWIALSKSTAATKVKAL
jgi:hypothetical protein